MLPGWAVADETAFTGKIRPLMQEYCFGCHSAEKHKGDLDLERFESFEAAKREPKVWQQLIEQIEAGEMPPEEKKQPSDAQKQNLLDWAKGSLAGWARERDGDPGPVVLRRLSNAEYTWTIRDLTGVPELDPAREFPVDGAAGEGFTNVGAALVMSPALVDKYLQAGKDVAAHAVLLPDGIGFSSSTTPRDLTEEKLAQIRAIYSRYSVPGEGMALNLQGLRFDTLDGGVIPLEKYFAALLEERAALTAKTKTPATVAKERGLSGVYLGKLWTMLQAPDATYPLSDLTRQWRSAGPGDAAALATTVKEWQRQLFRFHPVGQIGKRNGPKSWQEGLSPVVEERELNLRLPKKAQGPLTLTLLTEPAGQDGGQVQWQDARLLRGKGPALPLPQLEAIAKRLEELRTKELARSADYLAALAEAQEGALENVAAKRGLNPALLANWAALSGIGRSETPEIRGHFTNRMANIAGNPLVKAWGSPQTPSMTVNAAAETLRFSTLTLPARSVALHPSPELEAFIAWRSPIAGKIHITGEVADADGNCGNGIAWHLDLRNRRGARGLGAGVIDNGGKEALAPGEEIAVEKGDLVVLNIQPRDKQHICDTTLVSLELRETAGSGHWKLSDEVIDRVHDANPLADSHGNPEVWHFGALPLDPSSMKPALAAGSLLGKWREAVEAGVSTSDGALAVRNLLTAQAPPANDADKALYQSLHDPDGPLGWLTLAAAGMQPSDIAATAPAKMEFQIPAALATGAEFVAKVRTVVGPAVSVKAQCGGMASDSLPFVAKDQGKQELLEGLSHLRAFFPAALCYTKIVPVDEVITLRLFYREDDAMRRIMLSEEEIAELDQLWRELDFISQAPLKTVDAYEQLWQYATQDADPMDFEPLRKPVADAAEAFRKTLLDAEPRQLESAIRFGRRAWRGSMRDEQAEQLRRFYQKLRADEIAHEEALRLVLVRALTAPAFLYKMETPGPAKEAVPVSGREMASRLSYFLWSSGPDEELLRLAASGELNKPEVLAAQARRMLKSPKVRRLAIEFGTQWLHVRDFDQLDEKSETVFPEFAGIRGDLNEEPVRFFTDLFQNDGQVSDLLDADHGFVNGALAKYYGIPGIEGEGWQRVEGMKARGRGGILGFGATLARQSGASRTSPILRGTWVCETILGEHLPSPPKDVPVLPEQPPEGLSERALTEMHAKDPACSRCHAKIDPYGFALEHYDAIGRFRTQDITGQAAQAAAKLPGGKQIEGIEGLRGYLVRERGVDFRRQFCRKLLGYALGRAVMLSDEPLLERLQARDQSMGRIVEEIVRSRQFREIRGKEYRDE